jgi:hypothetical protein
VELQRALCRKYGAPFYPTPQDLKAGVAGNVREGVLPVNGLRLAPEEGTSGWFIWAGEEMSDADDFFLPLHVAHLQAWCPQAIRFLGLPPGWRFLVADEYEDVWADPSLLESQR